MLDLDTLLSDIDDGAPSGPDLEYDPEFIALELSNQSREERVVGDSVIPAEEPDYPAVARDAAALLERSRDLRIANILAIAALRSDGLPAFEEILGYIRRSLDEHWSSVHPQLDSEDDDDPTMRVNAVLGLTDRETTLNALRSAPLTNSRAFGRFSLRDIQVAEGELTPPEGTEAPSLQAISAAFQDSDQEELSRIATSASQILEHVKAIGQIFDDRIGTLGPDLTPLQRMAHEICKQMASHVVTDAAGLQADDMPETDIAGPAPVAAARPSIPGAITSPEDVKRTLDRIIDYYARQEPSSPVPILLARAKRLVSADFLSIMKDMAPNGIENVHLIGGIQEEDDY